MQYMLPHLTCCCTPCLLLNGPAKGTCFFDTARHLGEATKAWLLASCAQRWRSLRRPWHHLRPCQQPLQPQPPAALRPAGTNACQSHSAAWQTLLWLHICHSLFRRRYTLYAARPPTVIPQHITDPAGTSGFQTCACSTARPVYTVCLSAAMGTAGHDNKSASVSAGMLHLHNSASLMAIN